MRTFVAVEAPEEIKHGLAEVSLRLQSSGADVRWEPREKFHATLKFLGETKESHTGEIIRILEGIADATHPLTVRFTSVGCFPNMRDPRVLWVGMDDPGGGLRELQQRIEATLTPLGFEPEDRDFHPHITLGRVKSRHRLPGLLRMMESVTFDSEEAVIRELEFIRSDLKPSGSVYSTLKVLPFTA